MQTNKSEFVWRRAAFSGRTLLTALAIAVMVVVLPGCPMRPCDEAGVCDDDDLCTVDACSNGVDTNGMNIAVCTNTPVECPGGDLCDPADGECVECLTNADCDDGLFCNGPETCGTDNACDAGTNPCGADETCDETADVCVPTCTSNADCPDDGLFCNGAESCDLATGLCVSSGDPCGGAAEPVCDETNDVCVECLTNADCTAPDTCVDNVCTPPAPECTTDADCEDDGLFCNGAEFCNTSGVPAVCASEGDPCEEGQTCDEDADACTLPGEGFVLTSDDDAITGTTGDDTFTASVGTLNPDDIIVGSGGNDTLNANIAGSTSSLATLIDIDTVNFTTLNNATFDLANSAAIGLISVTGTGNLTLDNAEGDTAYQMGAGYAERLRVTLDDDSAADDEMDLTVAGTAEGASFDYLQDADAVETLNVMVTADSDLSPADPGTDLFGDVDEALITGTGALTLSGVDPVDLAANAPDTTDFEGTLTVAPAADAGHTFNFTAGGLANLEGIDAYVITDTMTFNHSITLNDSPVSVDISLIDEDDSAGNVTVVQSTANDDELNLTLGGDGDGMGALTAATSEFINIVSGGTTANAIANVTGESGTAFVTETVTVTGDQDIDLGTVTSEMLDATGLTGALTMTAAASMAIDGGSGDDDITGSAAVDLIDAGAGNDTITGDDGDDDLTGGDGDNTFVYVSVFESGGNDDDGDDNIADFDAGDAIELDDSNAFADGTADLTNTGVCTDDSIDIDNDGTDTTILIDTDTDGAAVNCVTIVLEGVTFDDTDFTFDADTELLTLVE